LGSGRRQKRIERCKADTFKGPHGGREYETRKKKRYWAHARL